MFPFILLMEIGSIFHTSSVYVHERFMKATIFTLDTNLFMSFMVSSLGCTWWCSVHKMQHCSHEHDFLIIAPKRQTLNFFSFTFRGKKRAGHWCSQRIQSPLANLTLHVNISSYTSHDQHQTNQRAGMTVNYISFHDRNVAIFQIRFETTSFWFDFFFFCKPTKP